MKRVILLLLIVSGSLWSVDIVNIWSDNLRESYGLSVDRMWIKSYFLSNFQYYSTIDSEDNRGLLTAVTIDRDLFFKLNKILKFEKRVDYKNFSIIRDGDIFNLVDYTNGIDISFSMEKPGQDILHVIDRVYKNDPKNCKAVRDHYLNTWVIRIYRGENVIEPDLNIFDYTDALINATILGESFQWLWGIHDGADYLSHLFTTGE